MMAISIKDVEYVAELCQLAFTEEEKAAYAETLSSILDYMEQLQSLDTADVEPTSHVLPLTNVFREDVIRPCLDREKALANAPDRTEDCFLVPKIM